MSHSQGEGTQAASNLGIKVRALDVWVTRGPLHQF